MTNQLDSRRSGYRRGQSNGIRRPSQPAVVVTPHHPERLFALGCRLASAGIQNAFIAISADDVTVTPFVGHQPQPSMIYRADELKGLPVEGESVAAETPPARQAKLLELVGHALHARACHTAFLVLYDGAAIVDVGDPDSRHRIVLAPWIITEAGTSVA